MQQHYTVKLMICVSLVLQLPFFVPNMSGAGGLSVPNTFLEILHFSMETAKSIRWYTLFVTCVASIDLLATYFPLPSTDFIHFLNPDVTGDSWELCQLAAPWVFTNFMREINVLVNGMGISACWYCDTSCHTRYVNTRASETLHKWSVSATHRASSFTRSRNSFLQTSIQSDYPPGESTLEW